MLYDLLTILLIVGFSYLFKISATRNYDGQLVFILLSLVIMIVYKFLIYRQLTRTTKVATGKTDAFTDFTDELNDFLKKDVPSGVSSSNINEYRGQLTQLQDKVDTMNDYLKNLNELSTKQQLEDKSIGGVDFQAGQQIQDYRIKKLQEDIQRTSDLIKQSKLLEDAKKYNKIKVLSSCVVSNADGSTSIETPRQLTPGTQQQNTMGVAPSNGMTSSAASVGVNSSLPAPPNNQSLGAGSGVDISNILESIAQNGLDIKLTK